MDIKKIKFHKLMLLLGVCLYILDETKVFQVVYDNFNTWLSIGSIGFGMIFVATSNWVESKGITLLSKNFVRKIFELLLALFLAVLVIGCVRLVFKLVGLT